MQEWEGKRLCIKCWGLAPIGEKCDCESVLILSALMSVYDYLVARNDAKIRNERKKAGIIK